MPVPIVEHHRAAPDAAAVERAEALAAALGEEEPDLLPGTVVRRLLPTTIDDGPALHLDDVSEIPLLGRFYDITFMQDRARFRAGEGDLVATCTPVVDPFEAYCEHTLGLGRVTWLRPTPDRDPVRVAGACWTDPRVRHQLVHALKRDRLAYLHPHLGSFPVWALAHLLSRAARTRLRVIAPPPGLAKAVNDKGWFARLIERLFGPRATPRVEEAGNLATLSRLAQRLAQRSGMLVLKLPDSAGGAGNLVIDAKRIRGRPLGDIRRRLKARLRELGHAAGDRILIGHWEEHVLASPSTQLWLPPREQGAPIVEGVFEQVIEGEEGFFMGSRAARLPETVTQHLVDRSWLVALVLQRLGYVGRCSFDLIVAGSDFGHATSSFIECNGRWGGTSTPMTLMNRLFGDWQARPYTTREVFLDGLDRWSYAQVLDAFAPDLYRAETGGGRLIFYGPAGLTSRSAVSMLAMGGSWEEATHLADAVTGRLQRALERSEANGATVGTPSG